MLPSWQLDSAKKVGHEMHRDEISQVGARARDEVSPRVQQRRGKRTVDSRGQRARRPRLSRQISLKVGSTQLS